MEKKAVPADRATEYDFKNRTYYSRRASPSTGATSNYVIADASEALVSVWRTSAAASWVFDNWALQPEEALHGRLTAGARTVNGALSSTPWRSQYLLLGPPLGAFRSFATPWVAYVPMAFPAGGGRSFCSVRRLAAAFECTMLIGARRRPARPPRRHGRPRLSSVPG